MNSQSRPRTRNQWDEHYKNIYNENIQSCGRRASKRTKNVVDESKSNSVPSFFPVSRVKKELDVIFDIDSDVEIEFLGKGIAPNSSCFGRRASKRTKNVVDGSKSNNVPSLGRVSRENKELDVSSDTDSDVEIEFLGKGIVPNSSSLKPGPTDNGESSGKRGRGRPRKTSLDEEHISKDVCIEIENFMMNSGDSSKSLDESDVDKSLSEVESSSEEEDDAFSDEDYKASSSESLDGPCYSSSDYEQENDGGGDNESLMNGEESDEGHDEDDRGASTSKVRSNPAIEEDVVIVVNDSGKFPSVGKSTRITGKKAPETEHDDDESDKGCHATHDENHGKKTSYNRKKDDKSDDEIDKVCHATQDDNCGKKTSYNRKKDDVLIISDDEEKFPSHKKSAKINKKTRKEGDSSGFWTACKVNFKVDDNLNKSDLNKRKVSGFELPVGSSDENNGKEDLSFAKWLKSSTISRGDTLKSSRDEDIFNVERNGQRKEAKQSKKKSSQERTIDLIKVLVKSINSLKDHHPIDDIALTQSTLPLRFRFEDEVPAPHIKSDWEKETASLFCDLELGLIESEVDTTNSSVMENDDISAEIDQSPAACCGRGDHQPIMDEQIGFICQYCFTVILDIKHYYPPFYTPRPRTQERKYYDESPSYAVGQIQFQNTSHAPRDATCRSQGTVWDLIPGVEKELFPHQREGFEFMWKNIAGGIVIEEMKSPLSGGRGCIISHAPGTGKTRLTIVFLQTFLKMYPTCRPVIIAPRGMLLTWEAEFVKWNVNVPFHNLNKKELSENEYAFAAETIGQVVGQTSVDCVRLVKLASWLIGGSILGISYQLFNRLVEEYGEKEGLKDQIKKLLLECPGLLVLDEGHTPRNDQSHLWKALSKVATQRRIILSGTPFQNNLTELYNTLCIVNPKFVNQIKSENTKVSQETRGRKGSVARKKWMDLTSCIGQNKDDGLKKLRVMLDPFVHVHTGTILKDSLPGLRETLVFLHPTEFQKDLLEACTQTRNIFHRMRQVSLVSVHPSLMEMKKNSSALKTKLEEIESVIEAGVKTQFVIKLIHLANALGERVLIFSQFLGPLIFIKKKLESRFSWHEGREYLYMDGQLDERQRQDSICSFNDEMSDTKVLLASQRACSEGINLIGASRVVLLDTVWNPAVEKQAVSRAYRLGQKKVVYVYRLFTSGTEVRQYALQIHKKRISQLIFSKVDGQSSQGGYDSVEVSEDRVLETMLGVEGFSCIFEKIIRQPKESDLIEIFGLVDQH